MSLKDTITEDMKTAMRAKDAPRLLTIRGLLAAIKQREVDDRIVLDDTAVIAIVDNRAGLWRVGEPVTAAIALPGTAGSVTVPAAAVQTVENRSVVFVRTPSGFTATPVTIGQTSGSTVTVTTGLTGREEIAGAGSFTLKAELGKGEAEHED